jgi:hypothetical protein
MRRLTNFLGCKLSQKPILYYILNFTWGIILTLLGYVLLLILLPFGKVKRFNYCLYLELNKTTQWGFSMGTVFFVGKYAGKSMKQHEFGHTVQNAILGPFMIFLVSLPSLIRFWYRNYLYSHGKYPKTAYDSIWFEGSASYIGLKHGL